MAKTKKITVRLPEELHARIMRVLGRTGKLSGFILEAIEDKLLEEEEWLKKKQEIMKK